MGNQGKIIEINPLVPLEPGGGVFGSHALVAVRQQHDESRLSDPFGLTGSDKLIDDTLRRVVEIAELRLPNHQRVRVGHRVT